MGEVCAGLMLVWEGSRRRSGRGLCSFDACMRGIQRHDWVRFVQVWCWFEKNPDAGVGEVCTGLMLVWEELSSRSGWDFCRFDASMRKIQTQEWVRFAQVWCKHEKDSDARVAEICAGLMLIWEGFRRRSERGVCRFGARMRRIQTQEWVRLVQFWCLFEKDSEHDWVRFVQVWCGVYGKDSDARVGEVCAGLMLVWEGFRRRSERGVCRFGARMRRIQTQEWVRLVPVLMLVWEGFRARLGEVCAGLMLVWEESRRRSGRGLCSFDACMRRIQRHDWVRFVQVWCWFEKNPDAGVGEVCTGLMLVWEGFRRRSGWGLCMFDACMRRIQTQEFVRFGRVWCVYEKDSDAGVGEVCAGLIQAWEGFWCKSARGLCRFDAFYEKDSEAGLGEVCAGLMLVWEGLRRRSFWGLCRFDACMRKIQAQEWVRFVQVWCKHEKDSEAGVGEVCAGLMQAWEGFRSKCGWDLCRFDACIGFRARLGEVCAGLMLVWEGSRRRSGRGLCSFDACMRRIQRHDWVRFVQVWCWLEKNPDAGVGEVCTGLMLVWEELSSRSGWDFCRFDASMRKIQTQEWVRFAQVWCKHEKDSDARVAEICAGLMLIWEGFRRRSERRTHEKDSEARVGDVSAVLMLVWEGFRARLGEVCAGLMLVWEASRRRSGRGLCSFDACMRRIQRHDWVRFVQVWCWF